jgi:hypothetical protein
VGEHAVQAYDLVTPRPSPGGPARQRWLPASESRITTGSSTGGDLDVVDAECVNTSNLGWLDYVVDIPDETLPELQENSITREWVPVGVPSVEGCVASHECTIPFAGAGAPVNFRIYDGTLSAQDPAWFGDNSGSLTVQIWLDN